MSRVPNLIKEIRDRLNELELLNSSSVREITSTTVDISSNNFRISDSLISFNKTDFQISKPKLIELCNLIVNHTGSEINIKPFVETIDPNRCNSYCIVKEIPRREKFLKEDENLYYDLLSKKYYSQCRMPQDKGKSNYCARHTGITQTDVSNMKILTDSKYIVLLDASVKEYCKMYLSSSLITPVPAPPPTPARVQIIKSNTSPVSPVSSILKKASSQATKALKKAHVAAAPKQKEPLSSESDSDSTSEIEESEESDISEVDMIVSKVIETLKPVPSPSPSPISESESGSDVEDPEDSDDCMLDADEIHDEEGNTYYIDEAKSVIKLDEDGYGVRLGMLKEFKSGNLFYKNKRWKIDYFPKK